MVRLLQKSVATLLLAAGVIPFFVGCGLIALSVLVDELGGEQS